MRLRHLLLRAALLLPLLSSALPAAAPPTPPDLAGVWSGTMSGTTWSLQDGVKPVAVRVPVVAAISVDGGDLSVALTIRHPGGDRAVDLGGRTGNGAFWAGLPDPDSPVLMAGAASGKGRRMRIKARGVLASPEEVAEVTFSLKRSTSVVLGTAAAGAPVAGALVTLKDRHGQAAQAVTGPDGRYSLDVARLDPPFLMKVDLPSGGRFFGVATEAGVANLHPLTDLILRTWFEVQGADPEAAFDTLDDSTPVPTAMEVGLLEQLVRRVVAKWLEDEGVDPGTFDLLRSGFAADGTGFDALLEITSVSPDGGSLTIADGGATQDTTFTCSVAGGSVTADTTITSGAGTSESRDGTALPGEGTLQDAVEAAMATLEKFRARVNARGAALTASDLEPFLAPDFLDEGLGRAGWAAQNATGMRGLTVGEGVLRSVVSFDEAAGLLELDVDAPILVAGAWETHLLRMRFRPVGSAWLMLGDGRIAQVLFAAEYRADLASWGGGFTRKLQLDVEPPVGTVQSVTISGGGLPGVIPVPKGPETRIVTLHPTPDSDLVLEWDMFYASAEVAGFPAPGTEFQLTITPVSGPARVYTLATRGTTTEAVEFLAPTGHSLAEDAHPGTPVSARWTRPTTFSVARMEFSGTGRSEHYAMDVEPEPRVSRWASEGSVTIPATAGGETVTRGDLWLSFEGSNGETVVVVWNFE